MPSSAVLLTHKCLYNVQFHLKMKIVKLLLIRLIILKFMT